eukprot:2741887-Rhodomonas_salina.2
MTRISIGNRSRPPPSQPEPEERAAGNGPAQWRAAEVCRSTSTLHWYWGRVRASQSWWRSEEIQERLKHPHYKYCKITHVCPSSPESRAGRPADLTSAPVDYDSMTQVYAYHGIL